MVYLLSKKKKRITLHNVFAKRKKKIKMHANPITECNLLLVRLHYQVESVSYSLFPEKYNIMRL